MALDATSLFESPGVIPSAETALATLPTPLRSWFVGRFGSPTLGQRLSWPVITAGNNLLVSAPTGSGKTLAAFLPIVGRLLDERDSTGIKALYVAPLKALIADARKNLRVLLQELRCTNPEMRLPRVGRRTGDTPERVRRVLRRRPPEVLLTTPESLAVLLCHPDAAGHFAGLRWIIVDEVHSLAMCKRGADLALSLERVESLSHRPIQRIGLSATCAPVTAAAGFLVGVGRPCVIARVNDHSPLDLVIEPLEQFGSGFLRTLLDRLEREIESHQTTLVFANTRNLAERVTWLLRRRWPDRADAIAVHHSSLSAARRKRVERQLKRGELRVVVSSTSLELGIDIGSVDAVVLVHPPGGAVKLLQRVGRSGHSPRSRRRGLIFTASSAELLEATVTAASSRAAQYEPLHIIHQPLDVLCQQLLGMAVQGPHAPDDVFALVKRAYPYRELARDDFNACLDYLSGRTQDGRDWLPSRLRWAGDEFAIVDERTARLLRRNLGTILADEVRLVRMGETPSGRFEDDFASTAAHVSTVGHVDEPFADRLQPGDRFVLDGRCLEFRRTEGRSLIVEEAGGYSAPPRWQGTGWPVATELAARIYLLRIQAAESLRDGPRALARLLRDEYNLTDPALGALIDFFGRQECVSEIPDAATCLVEVIPNGSNTDHYIHTPLNRAGNDALARVAVLRLVRDRGRSAGSIVADLGFLLSVGGNALNAGELRTLLGLTDFDADLDEAVRTSWSLRERFHGAALIGFMLLRNPVGGRRRVGGHDWAERRLFDRVLADDPDFVLLRQARAEVNTILLDADAAREYLAALPRKRIRLCRLAGVSPLAESWTQPAAGPVESVESPAEALQRLHAALMENEE